ncbi:MAG: zinc-binding dehydrogenase [Treponema sp.]|jgi:threonine dehydrogenase-like Zn-dependent dehydrogenase|nr:zinc-binding dehydrogenase [Treponema sp.]
MKTDVIYLVREKTTEIRQIDIPAPKPWQVQVEVVACGVCAWDAYLFKGLDLLSPFPFAIDHEAVGIIRETGGDVKGFSLGDCVFCIEDQPQMQMAQFTNIDARKVGLLPGCLKQTADFVQYIAEPCLCVINGMTHIDIVPGDRVIVIGTGYMGLLNVQAFRHSHISTLTCFDIDEKKLKLAKAYGADVCWISGSPEAKKAVDDIICSGGADIVVECSGSQPGLQLATDLVRNGGIISNFAWHRAVRTVDASPWHLRGLRIINTAPALDPHFYDNVNPTARLLERGVFNQKDLITHVMDYHKIQEMLTIAESKSDGYIKGVVTFK